MTELGERDRALAEVRRAQDDGRLGDARELLKLLKRRLPPDDCELLAAEGLQALGEGRMREAAGLLQRALASGATDPEVLFALGRLTAMAGRPDQAVPLLSRAAEQRPDHADTWLTLGICQNALALSHAALESFDQALGINPGLAEAHAQSGAIRLAAGEFAAARKALGKALACQPGHAAARISLAVACEMQGQTTEGLEALEPLFMNNHPPTRARLARARLLRRAGDFELARSELETLLKRTDLEPGDRGRAEFLLAELDDKAGRPDSAFVHAAEGCRLKSVRYDPRQDEHAADVVMRYFNAERLASLARARSTGPGPVFIVGMPRSGTSLLEQMLGAHPATRPCGETSLVTNLAAEIARRLGGFPGGLDKATEADLTALAHDYRQALGKSDGLILDKTVTNFWHLGLIDRLFPDARIIHCTRDPRDTLLSCYLQNFDGDTMPFSYDLDHLGRYHMLYRRLMTHWRSLERPPVFDVAYEALVTRPRETLEGALAFLKLDWNDACLAFHRQSRVVVTASNEQVRQPLYESSIGRHRAYARHLAGLDAYLDSPAGDLP